MSAKLDYDEEWGDCNSRGRGGLPVAFQGGFEDVRNGRVG